MFRRLFLTALTAGLLSGLGISVVQVVTTTPIILHAEEFEHSGSAKKQSLSSGSIGSLLTSPAHAHDNDGAAGDWSPDQGLERTLFTTLANVLLGIGYALILTACFVLSRRAVDGRIGVIWGAAGFAVTGLAPALGVPPELPGTMAAELGARQSWWIFCVIFTGAGLWALVFRKGSGWLLCGLALLVIPHLVGAPQPSRIGGAVPPELAAQFAAASLVTAAVFWCSVGWLSGTLWKRLENSRID